MIVYLYFVFLSGEKAIKKKQICVKMVHRASTSTAITDLIILSKSKNVPLGFILAGLVECSV
jgi:ESCRT-I complex subunit MVB12